MDMLAVTARQHQVRPLTFGNRPAVVQPQRLGRVFAHQTNGLREGKGVALVVGDAKAASSRLAG